MVLATVDRIRPTPLVVCVARISVSSPGFLLLEDEPTKATTVTRDAIEKDTATTKTLSRNCKDLTNCEPKDRYAFDKYKFKKTRKVPRSLRRPIHRLECAQFGWRAPTSMGRESPSPAPRLHDVD